VTQRSETRTVLKSRHATAVAVAGRALLITGPSGSGKSTLALEMIALGAALISDDQVMLTCEKGAVIASAPAGAPALIESRGMGLIAVGELAPPTPIALILDLDVAETERLPLARAASVLGISIRSLRKPKRLSAAALLLALRGGGLADPDRG
jgi:HPr kinase/phosphorylase